MGKGSIAAGLFLAGFAINLGVMVYGWGLEPLSWAWIIGGYIGAILSMAIGSVIAGD